MKKLIALVLTLVCVLGLVSCSKTNELQQGDNKVTIICNISSLRRSLKWMKHTYCWKYLTREIAIFLKVQRLKYQRIQYLPMVVLNL